MLGIMPEMLAAKCQAGGLFALAAIPPAGGYISLAKIIFMLVAVTPWLAFSPWVYRDARQVHASGETWGATVLGAGGVGFLIWLLLPVYFVGLVVYVVLTGSAMIAYVVYRNGRVPDEAKVLTTAHLSSLFGSIGKRRGPAVVQKVTLYRSDGKPVLVPEAKTAGIEEVESYNILQELLHDVLWRRASEVDLSPTGEETRLRYIIDGVTVNRPSLDLPESEVLIQYVKPLAGMDEKELRRPQEGKITVDIAGSPMEVTVRAAGTTNGQRLQFHIVREVVQTKLNDLGMSEEVFNRVKEMMENRAGLFIVSGLPGSGVTSTMYSLLRQHDAFMNQLMTLESKIVVNLENITQRSYGEPAKLATELASVLRRDPDVIMIDRCYDQDTAETIATAAGEKGIVLGMEASDSLIALAKWIKLCNGKPSAVDHLKGIFCQVLVRKVCPNCREAYRPDPHLLAKVNLPAEKIDMFFRPPTRPLTDEKGRPVTCQVCQGSGYFGRVAAFELLEVTDELRQLIASGGSLSQIRNACRKKKMLYLQEQAIRKVIEGVTSIQEVIRVSKQPKKKR